MIVSLRQNGVGPEKNCADAILPKGHEDCVSLQDESNGNMLKITDDRPISVVITHGVREIWYPRVENDTANR